MNISKTLQNKQDRRLAAISEAEYKTQLLHKEIPKIATIDLELSNTSVEIMRLATKTYTDEESFADSIKQIERKNKKLLAQRSELLQQNGYDKDYDKPVFDCPVCMDTGYVELVFCECVKRDVNTHNYLDFGLGKALSDKSFDNFYLKYYSAKQEKGISDLDNMEIILQKCKRYSEKFGLSGESLLMLGGTGLGKTHLSAAIGKKVLDKGYMVFYDSAQSVFSAYEAVRFSKEDKSVLEKYENSDLLIIDDLGAECMTQYTIAVFSTLLNWRIVNSLPTIISTNLNSKQIKQNYGERVYSRLFGEFTLLRFSGRDVRLLKLSEK